MTTRARRKIDADSSANAAAEVYEAICTVDELTKHYDDEVVRVARRVRTRLCNAILDMKTAGIPVPIVPSEDMKSG